MNNAQAARLTDTDLFTPLRLGRYVSPNRIVMAPLTRNRAGPGNVPQAMNARYYAQHASAGLIITEATQISPQGVGYPGHPGDPQLGAGRRLEKRDPGRTRAGRSHLSSALARGPHLLSLLATRWGVAGGALGDPASG